MVKHTALSRVSAQPSDLPIARLGAQDLEQSLPIREYLEQHGVAVVVNRKPSLPAVYHIITGDVDFVKEATASASKSEDKPFVVLFLRNRQSVPRELHALHAKIAVVIGSVISTRDVEQLFAHFFTGDDTVFYLENDKRPQEWLRPDRLPRVKKFPLGKTAPFLFVVTLIAPIVWYFVSLAAVASVQWYGVMAVARGDVSRIQTVARVTTYWVGQGKGALAIIGIPVKLVGAGRVIRGQERLLSVAHDVATGEQHASELIAQSSKLAPILPSGSAGGEGEASVPVIVDRMRLALDGMTGSLGLAGAELRQILAEREFPFTIPRITRLIRRGEEEIASALVHAEAVRSLLTLYRAAGGFDGKKTYLVLLQNSMELRPTGGFIGSVATVTAQDGAVETPIVQDVYALDGQLKGHVDPPRPIKELLRQEHWYLRDSNWDPDFRVSAERAAWFYGKETGARVDGVIAIATPLLTDLLAATGPLDLPDYNDRITKENFFGKSLFYTKADFFPGSTQKKDFLGSLMVALLSRLTSGWPKAAAGLMQVLRHALEAGDMQFWFPDRETQAIAQQAGWAGELFRPMSCETSSPGCTVERIALVESNMGVNKGNAFIKRSVKTRVDVASDGVMDGAIAITYQNTSTDDTALTGGGVYLGYLRVFLPPDALVTSVGFDGEEIPPKVATAPAPTTPYRDADETVAGLTAVSVAFTVPPGSERRVTISYRRGVPFALTQQKSTFVLSIRKQPGVTDTMLDAAIGYPAGWQAASSDGIAGLLANAREVRYNTPLDQTKTFVVRFSK